MKWMGLFLGTLMVAVGLVSTSLVFAQDAAAPAAAPGSAPVMKTDRLMKVFADPLIDTLKNAMKEPPATPKAWRIIQDQGEAAAEVANLTMMREGDHESAPEWDPLAESMKKAGLALSESAAKKDFADAQAKFTVLIQSCNDCHKKFEPETAPEILP